MGKFYFNKIHIQHTLYFVGVKKQMQCNIPAFRGSVYAKRWAVINLLTFDTFGLT